MDDLIRRQAALDAIMGQPPEPHYPSWYAAQIEKLPAAQPAANCSEIPNGSDDTISRQAALETIRTMQTYKLFAGDDMLLIDQAEAQTELMMLPSAQPERKGTRLSTVCLLCKKPAVTFNTEDDIPYTNYSYCEDCLRKGLKLLREQKKNLQAQSERKTGRWIPCPQNASWLYVYKCSECGGYLQISDVDGIGITAKYCSYCGAKMEGGEQE